MGDLLKIAVATALINNVVLSQFLGLCPFLGVSKKTKTAAGMGGAVIFVMTIASILCYGVYDFILVPFNVEYLETIVFILLILLSTVLKLLSKNERFSVVSLISF